MQHALARPITDLNTEILPGSLRKRFQSTEELSFLSLHKAIKLTCINSKTQIQLQPDNRAAQKVAHITFPELEQHTPPAQNKTPESHQTT
ncbi:MAG TPA: hypothetical protein VIZ86_07075, partial [Pseudomonas sp.]